MLYINLILIKHYTAEGGQALTIKREDNSQIPSNSTVIVTQMGHLTEVQYMEKMNRTCNIQKLDKDRYADLKTGEIKEFKHSENRKENYNSLRQTFKKLRYLINNNFFGSGNELHVVLTYKENITDPKQLYKDFDTFMKRLKRKYNIDYINVIEPQGRGAWHCHLLIRFNDLDTVFIANSDLAKMWGHGFVTIKSLKDVDNIGAYLSAYLTDIELNENLDKQTIKRTVSEQLEIKEVEGKKFIKGGRLHMYPSGVNLFRKSRGIKYPDRKEMSYQKAKKIVGSAQPHFKRTYHIQDETFENVISYEQYNMKRQ